MKKRNMIATSLAVVLAVALLAGGTFTYLTGETEEVVNEFTTNQNDVELDETTGGEYDIVPGTSQEKDPTITATYTLDSYVFVEVTDATDDLVTWYIANGWTLLSETENTDGSTSYVYYQLLEANGGDVTEIAWSVVEGDDNTKVYELADGSYYIWDVSDDTITYYAYTGATGSDATNLFDLTTGNMHVSTSTTTTLQVLANNAVYYSSTLTNEDLANAEDISLTFQAYIIQAEPFADAANAWIILNGEGVAINDDTGIVYTDSVATAISEAEEGETVRLLKDNQEISSTITVNTSMTLELDGYTLSLYGLYLTNNADLILQNGTINSTDGIAQVYATTDSDITLLNLDLNVSSGHAIQAYSGTIEVNAGSSVTTSASGAYCAFFIGSNNSANDGKKLTINVYGTVESENSYYAISGNGSYDYTSTEINIYDGATVSAPNGMAIYHPQDYGVINIYGGTVTGYNGILIAGGTLNIYGGSVFGTANDTDYRSGASGTYYNGCAICVNAATGGYSDVTVNISGGTISSTYCYGLWADAVNNVVYTATINITGGTFSGVVSDDTDINQTYSSTTGDYAVSNYGVSSGKIIINDNR